ncbi:hypothetical protein O6H91_05G127500 [Diphasiastrum complanatum]|uniref:Uncharacterized protein n=3 Tax=Diphasiastrum complanatum TaxID=34168 RepID=A0ACC2DTE1_DIPCM|nr:hypothetical protein O6H91_05G127500 [Diphasiastrum complanatum]KAJ7557463.1 hypothetical protein O6H91_05G127500 [Diphasiastrum complanatum]KAJ7557466.1 hypothetical protein O6H91_05G127500 [Diphasiastrum complanatum]
MQIKSDAGNGPGPLFQPTPPLFGGVPVDYGPRADDGRLILPKGMASKVELEEVPSSRHLWVGNVAQEVSEAYVADKFVKFGKLESVTVYPQRNYAFVNFINEHEAVNAKNKLQGSVLAGLRIRIEYAKGAKPSKQLWVGGICSTLRKEQIEAEFRKFGLVEDFIIMHDRKSALVHFAKLDDAVAAVEALNRKRMGNEELRVDFGRSQSSKKESKDDRSGVLHQSQSGALEAFRGPLDSLRNLPDDRGPVETFQGGFASRSNFPSLGGGKSDKDGEPSEILWVGFSLQTKVDDDKLIRAFIPYGEIQSVKTFPGRTYAFVQFRSVGEAIRAKTALEGKLFNDPRVSIRFSNSEIGPAENMRAGIFSPPARPEGTIFLDGTFKSDSILGHRMPPPVDRRVSSIGAPLSPGLRLGPDFSPSGNALGVGGRGMGPGTGLGRGVGRGHGLGSGGLIALNEKIDSSSRGRGGSFVPAAGQPARPSRPFDDEWDLPDEDIFNRESKRVRLGGFPQPPAENSGMNSKLDGQRFIPPNGSLGAYGSSVRLGMLHEVDDFKNGPGPRLNATPVRFDGPQPLASLPGPVSMMNHAIGAETRSSNSSESRLGVINEGWKWQGLVAKGGTPVCRARCFPVGKGIDLDLPDVINCTARTDLDMLAKHVHQAGDFGVVFFVPDGDVDVPPYQDFMSYLGEKHRAGVAKLSNGSTLFLVPPSEFSQAVLKVPGKNCLFGVVLKFQAQNAAYVQAPPPQQQQPQQQQIGFQSQMPYQHAFPEEPSQDSVAVVRAADQALQLGQGVTMPAGSSSQFIPAHLANIPLTPELIASLTALLPQQSSAIFQRNHIVPPINGVEAPTVRAPSAETLVNFPASASANDASLFPLSQNNLTLPSQSWPYLQQDQSGSLRGGFFAQSSGSLTSKPPEPSPMLQAQQQVQPQPQPQLQRQTQLQQHQHQPHSQARPPLPPLPPLQQNSHVLVSHITGTQHPGAGMVASVGQGFSQPLSMAFFPGPSPFNQLSAESISGQVFPQQLSTGNVPVQTQGIAAPQSQGYLGSGSSGPYLQQARPPLLSATAAPQLPADQLAQLTALLTQTQQQPAQQQAAQVLQQHYQQQLPTMASQHQQTFDNQAQQTRHSQQNLFAQQLQLSAMPQAAQPGWVQGSQGVVQADGVNWEGASPRSPQHSAISGIDYQQQQQQENVGDLEVERQKRFQATLHLAAALLQQMQQQQPKDPGGPEQH